MLERMLAFLASDPNVFSRAHRVGHFTGSGLVFVREPLRIALMHHRKLDMWIQFGGHADGDPDLASVALREAREESGLSELACGGLPFDLDIHPIPARGDEPEHLHYDVRYLLESAPGQTLHANAESLGLAWCTLEEAAELCHAAPSMLRQFAKLQASLERDFRPMLRIPAG